MEIEYYMLSPEKPPISDHTLITHARNNALTALKQALKHRKNIWLPSEGLQLSHIFAQTNNLAGLKLLAQLDICPENYFEACITLNPLETTNPDEGFSGFNPLHMAIYTGNMACFEWLLARSSNVNQPVITTKTINPMKHFNVTPGDTPLHLATRDAANPEMVHALLAAGADPTLRNFYGKHALDTREAYQHAPEILNALTASGLSFTPSPLIDLYAEAAYYAQESVFFTKVNVIGVLNRIAYYHQKYPAYQCQYFVSMQEFEAFLTLQNTLRNSQVDAARPQHLLCIVHPRPNKHAHTTLVYCDVSRKKPRALIFDSIGHAPGREKDITTQTNRALADLIHRTLHIKRIYTNQTKLQHEPEGCSLFNLFMAEKLFQCVIKGDFHLWHWCRTHYDYTDVVNAHLFVLHENGLPPFGGTLMWQSIKDLKGETNRLGNISYYNDARHSVKLGTFKVNKKGDTFKSYLERHTKIERIDNNTTLKLNTTLAYKRKKLARQLALQLTLDDPLRPIQATQHISSGLFAIKNVKTHDVTSQVTLTPAVPDDPNNDTVTLRVYLSHRNLADIWINHPDYQRLNIQAQTKGITSEGWPMDLTGSQHNLKQFCVSMMKVIEAQFFTLQHEPYVGETLHQVYLSIHLAQEALDVGEVPGLPRHATRGSQL